MVFGQTDLTGTAVTAAAGGQRVQARRVMGDWRHCDWRQAEQAESILQGQRDTNTCGGASFFFYARRIERLWRLGKSGVFHLVRCCIDMVAFMSGSPSVSLKLTSLTPDDLHTTHFVLESRKNQLRTLRRSPA